MNCPKKVVPAVCVGLLGLFALRAGSRIRSTGPRSSASFASIMTSLHELKGFEEKIGKRRPTGEAYSRNFGGTNWKEQRDADQRYEDREPTVLVVGGGQAGLSIASTLGRIGVDTLVVDRLPRVGDCWRTRYHSLALHNSTEVNHLPYMPFPIAWPRYLPKDMLADWFEAYAWAMEINFWTSTELVGGSYDESKRQWNAVVRNNQTGAERTLHPKHLVFASGLVGFAHKPELPGLKDFKGTILHTSEFTNGIEWRGKKALVIGTGTSGHDVAQDLHANGCDTTIVQRGSCTVVSIDPSAKLVYGIYEGIPLEDGDLLVSTNTKPITKKNLQALNARMTFAFNIDEVFQGVLSKDNDVLRYVIKDDPLGADESIGHDRDVIFASGGYLEAGALANFLSERSNPLNTNRYIHNKFMLVDPLSNDPLVVTGSANFSRPSQRVNDENMLVIRGDTRVADIYFGEFMRVFDHHYARYIVRLLSDEGRADPDAGYLKDKSADWIPSHFNPDSYKSKRRKYFASPKK